ncbi:MAG: DUF1573 domain-containing protein [Verrucomicrobiae bacterium]|nr:DUF1573 domain-containing protein [Verrucomicrobiae bacterium]
MKAPQWHQHNGLAASFVAALGLWLACCPLLHAQLKWDRQFLEFNPGVLDTNVTARFAFQNAGNYPITLIRVQSSCNCAQIRQERKTYQPGETGEIAAVFNFGIRTGPIRHDVVASTDDKSQPIARLAFKVNIPELIRISPPFVCWRPGDAATPKNISVNVVHSNAIHVTKILSNHPQLPARLKTITEGREYVIEITPSSLDKPIISTLRIETDFPPERPKVFYAHAMVKTGQ